MANPLQNPVLVTFRVTDDKLTSLCQAVFETEALAKQHIAEDAAHYCKVHRLPAGKWVKPESYDYFEVKFPRSEKRAIWQYFETPHFNVRAKKTRSRVAKSSGI